LSYQLFRSFLGVSRFKNCGQREQRGASEIPVGKAREEGKKARSIDRISASI